MRHYVHHIPGRLRVRVAGVKGNASQAHKLECMLLAREGIHKAEANPVTGSVLINYDPQVVNVDQLTTLLAESNRIAPDIDAALVNSSSSMAAGQKIMELLARTAAAHLAEVAVEKAALALIAAVL